LSRAVLHFSIAWADASAVRQFAWLRKDKPKWFSSDAEPPIEVRDERITCPMHGTEYASLPKRPSNCIIWELEVQWFECLLRFVKERYRRTPRSTLFKLHHSPSHWILLLTGMGWYHAVQMLDKK
jgi:hypothetical protein